MLCRHTDIKPDTHRKTHTLFTLLHTQWPTVLSGWAGRPTCVMAEQMIYVQNYTSKHTFRAPFEDKDSLRQTYTVNCAKPRDLQLFSSVSFLFPLMNSSSVRANNRDSSNEREDNSAAILTGIKWSGGWWHSWWDMESGRKVKRENWEDDRKGDLALPSDCKANFKRSFQSVRRNKIWISRDEANKASKHPSARNLFWATCSLSYLSWQQMDAHGDVLIYQLMAMNPHSETLYSTKYIQMLLIHFVRYVLEEM